MNLSNLDLRSRLSVSTAIACTSLIAVVAGVLWGAESLAARTAGVVLRGTRGPRTSRAGLKRNNISSETTGAPSPRFEEREQVGLHHVVMGREQAR
jgi:hypothetical protein